MIVILDIPGVAKPGGSKTTKVVMRNGNPVRCPRTGRVITTTYDDAKGNAQWKANVKRHAAMQYRGEPLAVPLQVAVTFFMPRPKTHIGARGVRRSAPPFPTVKPDATKLWRSTEDALKGVVFVDDSLIVKQSQEKLYAPPGTEPHAVIVITRMENLS